MPKKDTPVSLLKEAVKLIPLILSDEYVTGSPQSFLDRAASVLSETHARFNAVRQSALERGLVGKPKKFSKEQRLAIAIEPGTLKERAKKYGLCAETVRKYQKEAKASENTSQS